MGDNDGQPVVGFSRYSADVNPLLLLDQENFDVIDSNYENENLSAGFSPVYIDALDQYVGVGLSGYELVFTGGDDPLFREPVARKSTLREIRISQFRLMDRWHTRSPRDDSGLWTA
jgi:hypothetical protein